MINQDKILFAYSIGVIMSAIIIVYIYFDVFKKKHKK